MRMRGERFDARQIRGYVIVAAVFLIFGVVIGMKPVRIVA
jgi:hypothetical protein